MGDTQDPTRLQGDALEAGEGSVEEAREASIIRLWAEFAQVVVPAARVVPNIWCKYPLTGGTCLHYHARAEGGQRFLKGAAASSQTENPGSKG